ncbi:hypothetical protein NYA30BAC_01000 [Halomonas sp. NYA30]|tara:strand:+ start:640 stop:1260 length:621 start_codon:yes stop_codon:yes gene_type:complete
MECKLEVANLVLEYMKALLTAPVMFAVVASIFIFKFTEDIKALLLRVAKIKLPGGTEVSTPQSNRIPEEEDKAPPKPQSVAVEGIPSGLSAEQQKTVENLVRSHIANTYLWEYRYLNYFLTRSTQVALDWLAGLPQPTTYAHYDSFWLPSIPSANERQAMITALQNHHLVLHDEATNMLTVTPKGHEYREWRGPLPALTNASIGSS